MLYKTIVLELLEQRPQIQVPLMKDRKLLQAVEAYALELNAKHEAWKEQLSHTNLDRDLTQISSEALELAIQDLERSLSSELPQEEDELSLDGAMAFLRRHTPPA